MHVKKARIVAAAFAVASLLNPFNSGRSVAQQSPEEARRKSIERQLEGLNRSIERLRKAGRSAPQQLLDRRKKLQDQLGKRDEPEAAAPPFQRRDLSKFTLQTARDLAKRPAEWPNFTVNSLARALYVLEVEAPSEASAVRAEAA